jgi:hypothetical protein
VEASLRADAVQRFLVTLDNTASELNAGNNGAEYAELRRLSHTTAGVVRLAVRTFDVSAKPTAALITLMRGLGVLVVRRWVGHMESPALELLVRALRAFVYTFVGAPSDTFDPLGVEPSHDPHGGAPRDHGGDGDGRQDEAKPRKSPSMAPATNAVTKRSRREGGTNGALGITACDIPTRVCRARVRRVEAFISCPVPDVGDPAILRLARAWVEQLLSTMVVAVGQPETKGVWHIASYNVVPAVPVAVYPAYDPALDPGGWGLGGGLIAPAAEVYSPFFLFFISCLRTARG